MALRETFVFYLSSKKPQLFFWVNGESISTQAAKQKKFFELELDLGGTEAVAVKGREELAN